MEVDLDVPTGWPVSTILAARDKVIVANHFASNPVKMIVYAWFNDEDTLRKAGSKTDVYEAFKRMLARGVVPASIHALLTNAIEAG